MEAPPLPPRCGSWVIIDRGSGRTVCELFERRNVERLDGAVYEAVPALTYLSGLNRRVPIKTQSNIGA